MYQERPILLSVSFAGVDEILAAMREQMFLAGNVVLSDGRSRGFSSIDVQTVLALLGETYGESDHVVVSDGMRHVFRQALLLDAVFVQGRHEVRQRSRHAKLNLQFAPGEH